MDNVHEVERPTGNSVEATIRWLLCVDATGNVTIEPAKSDNEAAPFEPDQRATHALDVGLTEQ